MRIPLQMGAAAALILLPAGSVLADDAAAVLPVAKRTIYPGDTILEDMITLKPAAQAKGVGAFATDVESLVGKTARRTLLPGEPIPKVAIREAYIVFQGKTVPLVFQSGTVTITGVALALESGSAGETISARNPDSGVVIRGVVQPDGSLRAD
ncbi:MAG TPA: flagellar basal body P-ring formation chaperone FlgA [Rhodomicrobium sp.]|nr:flagellar basal body P-ring formation chaperone FlgA [Rhodomicrobium sp.]